MMSNSLLDGGSFEAKIAAIDFEAVKDAEKEVKDAGNDDEVLRKDVAVVAIDFEVVTSVVKASFDVRPSPSLDSSPF